jgi:microcystin-dependent protein
MDAYLGEIRMFAGNYAPEDWAICNGSLLQVQEYEALFALISNTWGGDGSVTFAVPDLRGRLPVGQGAGPNLTTRVLATIGGSETVTLSGAAYPAHSHALMATTVTATSFTPGPSVVHGAAAVKDGTSATVGLAYANAPVNTAQILNDATITEEGGNQPHANLMPALAINYIIALRGLYPTPN